MQLFYTPDIQNETTTLSEVESHHCIKVLRLGINNQIQITDGKGHIFEAIITDIKQKKAHLKITRTVQSQTSKDYYVHIAIAPTKQIDRTEWFIEKCIEIGVQEISLLLCDNSERKHIKLDRLEKIAVSAMKQSGQIFLPPINPLTKFTSFMEGVRNDQKIIAYLDEIEKPFLPQVIEKNVSYCILIGPEGDFSKSEINLALNNGFQGVSLGDQRYRTETAGIVACHICNLVNVM